MIYYQLEEGIAMKTIFRFLSLGVLATAFIAAGSVAIFAQDPACADTEAQTKLQDTVRAKYKGSVADRKEAISAAKELLGKYGTCEFSKEFNEYLKSKMEGWEKALIDMQKADDRKAILGRFDAGIQGKKWDDVYAAGNEFAAKFSDDPVYINIIIPMGLIGFSESYPPGKNYKYNSDTVKYAKIALDKVKSGVKSTKPNGAFGAFQFECTKDDCISQLTYGLGYITYYAQDNKQAALPYFYEVTKLPGVHKENPAIYGTFGDYYFVDVKRLADEVQAMIKAQSPTDPDDVKMKKDADIKAKIALLNGYSERALDAYSRAYKFAKGDTPAAKTYKDNIYKQIQSLYNVRFAKEEGVDAWISAAVVKPLPDPTSTVTPIADPEPVTTTTGTAPTTASPTTTTAKPAATVPVKPATTAAPKPTSTVKGNGAAATSPAESQTAEKAKVVPVKAVAVKKKGTR